MNSSKLVKIDNKKIFSPDKIVITTLNNNIQIEQNDLSEEGLIKNLNNNKEFNEEEEYNLDMINQKYINNNIKEEDEEKSKEKNEEEYNNDEEKNDNYNDEFNNNIEYINNEYINDIDNNNENFDYKEYVYQNMENLENDEYENNKNEEENNKKEKDEEEKDELNEKYNLPLSINYNKSKIKIDEKKEEDNLEYKKSKNEIKNDYNDEIFNVEKNNIGEIENDKEDKFENNKCENGENNNENNIKENENKKDINYEDYILNTLSKLKKKNSSKLSKEKEIENDLIQQYNITEPDNIIEQKKKDKFFSVSPNINSYKSNKTFNEDDFNVFKDKNSLNLLPEINQINKEDEKVIPEGIKFGIDETGNPLNISAFFEKENRRKKLIAYIIQKNNISDNYLVDTKGNLIQKSEEGDYLYKDNDIYVVIKDFDVKHPELRIFGHRSYMFGKKNKELIIENKDIIDNNNKTNKLFENDSLNCINEKNNNNFYNDDEIEKRLFNNNINKNNKIHSYSKGKYNFDELMSIWRERYGRKNNRGNNYKEIKFNNYFYGNYEDRIIQRTNSILKMASEKVNKYDNNIKYNNTENKANSEINYIKKNPRLAISKKYNIPIYDKKILNKNYENPLLKKIENSQSNKSSNIMNNPLLKSKNILAKNYNDNFYKDIKYNKIEINTNNILNKNNSYYNKRNAQIKNNLIKNKAHKLEINSLTYKRIDIKNNNSIINNNIYDNITKINELNKTKKNNRYSILSNEANEVIKDYNTNILNNKNILKNRTFTNENNINNFNFVPIRSKNSFSINLNNDNDNDKNYCKIKSELNNKNIYNNKMKSFSFSKLYETNNNKITVNKRKMNK